MLAQALCVEDSPRHVSSLVQNFVLRSADARGSGTSIRIDHVPTLHEEANHEPGYAALGRLYAIGYVRGLCEAVGATLE